LIYFCFMTWSVMFTWPDGSGRGFDLEAGVSDFLATWMDSIQVGPILGNLTTLVVQNSSTDDYRHEHIFFQLVSVWLYHLFKGIYVSWIDFILYPQNLNGKNVKTVEQLKTEYRSASNYNCLSYVYCLYMIARIWVVCGFGTGSKFN
jgi:hypothetical protein